MAERENRPLNEEELQELVAASDSGARSVPGTIGLLIAGVALLWSVFQVLLASPVAPYVLPNDLINNARQIHLAFAIFLSAMAYPLYRSAPRHKIPWYDWVLGLGGAALAMYGYFFYEKIVNNGGLADATDAWFALAGLALLFIAAYRTLGPVMVILAIVFLLYVFFGSSELVPDQIRWAGASLRKAMSHMWISACRPSSSSCSCCSARCSIRPAPATTSSRWPSARSGICAAARRKPPWSAPPPPG
jgi:TRAP-type uncharacterized transport system fused permease subunit